MMKLKGCGKFRKIEWSVTLFVMGVLLLFSTMMIPPVVAASDSFQEDFTTTTYRDGTVSNGTGWGTGEIIIQREPLIHTDSLSIPGSMMGICVEGDIAYLAAYDAGLQVVNVSDPYNAFRIGGYVRPGHAYKVRVEGNLAFLVIRTEGLAVFNVSNPAAPIWITTRALPSNAYDVFIDGNYAYVACSGSVQVIDISDPLFSLPIVGATTDLYGADSIFVSGNYLYTTASTRFGVYDITDPTNPTYAEHRWLPSGSGEDVFVSGNYAFVAAGFGGMHVINITDPLVTSTVGSVETSYAWSVQVVGDMAYIADNNGGIRVIDVSDVTSPEILRRLSPGLYTRDVWVEGDYAYLAFDSANDFAIVKIANTKSPTIEGNYDTPDFPTSICVEGNYAFVTDYSTGLLVLDITDPKSPALAGTYSPPSGPLDVKVAGNYAFIACGFIGIVVVDITDPSQPSWVDTCDTPDYASSLDIDGDYVYVADDTSGLQVIDISDLSALTIVDAYDTPDNAQDVCVEGDYAYVADYTSVQVIDISDPTSITYAGSYSYLWAYESVTIAGDYLYVAQGIYGLRVLDISNPKNPVAVGAVATSYDARETEVQGNRAFIADSFGGLCVVDITDPAQPSYIETTDTNITNDVFVNGDYIYLADGHEGVTVVEVQQNLGRLFNGPARTQSLPIFNSTSETVTSATLTPIHSIPTGTSITYSLSADNGVNWEEITPGVEHIFAHPGKQLKWRAILDTSDILVTPSISNLTITYNTIIDAPILLSPSDTTLTGNNQPTFEWQVVSGATDYVLQIDIATTFNTPWLINVTVGDITYTPSSPLSDGTWYWRVAAIDGDGVLGLFSSYRELEIETAAPTWVETPENQEIELGSDFRYDLNATDPSGISK
ncbi:MAG: hypothetical protein KAU48_02890, partial [Candidatus Thorarchaeota archaeon]|nr:hypothetical protein [Candidatus Thorarchaeota archaeon]